MIKSKKHLLLLAEQARNEGMGSLVAIYNDIENEWHYYVGDFKPSNPSNHMHHSSIRGRCIDYILESSFTYFSGDMMKNELIRTELSKIIEESVEFDFKFVWFK